MPYQRSNPLVKWCRDQGLNQRQAAERLGTAYPRFRKQCAAMVRISWATAKRYERRSKGALKAYELMDFFEKRVQ